MLVLLTTSALGPLLEAVFEHFGGEAWKALQRFVRQILGDDRLAGDGDSAHPEAVVFQSATTGAQFVFTPGMPALAFRRAIEQAPDGGPGRWVWDSARGKWIKFEELST